MAWYLLSEDYLSLKSRILEIIHTMGTRTREQLVQGYSLPLNRPLDMGTVTYNYEESNEALLQIFTEANHRSMGEEHGRWHYPSHAEWMTTTFPPVRPDYEHAVLRSRM